MRPASARALGAFALSLALTSCGAARPVAPHDPVAELRAKAAASTDGEVVGRWLLAELLSQGGDAARAREARARLDQLRHDGLYASIARAIDDGGHGRLASAADAYLDALRAARASRDENAPLVAWFSTNHLLGLRDSTTGLWDKARPTVEETLDHPGSIGWRARSELVDWWSQEAYDKAEKGVLDLAAVRYGCAKDVRLAGPFGHGAAADRRARFAAEAPGPWPLRWQPEPGRHEPPSIIKTERHGCRVESADAVPGGVYYAETFIDLPAEREAIVAVQGAFAVFVDDTKVLERDTRTWAVWPKFGVHLRLSAGRHRILARVGGAETSIRLLAPDGTPLDAKTSTDARAPYEIAAPKVISDPNVLDRFVANGEPLPVADDVARYLASFLAHVEAQDDLASVLVEPLVKDPSRATGPSLAMAAIFAEKDPIFPGSDAHDLVKELRTRAVGKDAELWWPRYWLALDDADKRGLPDAVDDVRKLADHFREVPEILSGLAQLYGRLDWRAERATALRDVAKRFPNDRSALEQVLSVLDEEGKHAEADAVAARIKQLDPDSEVDVDRALARRDYPTAIAELRRLGDRRPDRKDIADRVADVMARAGNPSEAWNRLERALEKNPLDPVARLGLADAHFAAGDHLALRKALADAILKGADTSDLAGAVELVEGMTELEPYRLDGLAIIKQYEAAHAEMEGTAARVLDYSAVWIHPDGSSRMLEHELIRVQSQEAIGQMSEQRVSPGLVLRMRVIKKDGSILEPEFVSGKPTLTMPHLEVGDYIETESITTHDGDGNFGQRYLGPHWFFREADVAYFRSEFVVISPKEKPLEIETRGEVPAPKVTDDGVVVVRRWRVDRSPAAPEEPSSAPITEFLPSVRIGWGISLDDQLKRLVDAASDELPRDPRLARVAHTIADTPQPSASGPTTEEERARRLYRWVMTNVEDGREGDGRRVIIGKSGNRLTGYLYLLRLAGISAELGVTRDKLSPPPQGPLSEAEQFDDFLLRVGDRHPIWMTVHDKFAPFGYLPSEVRGQPVYRLVSGTPKETTASDGTFDGIVYQGTGELHPDGSATLDVSEQFVGKLAIGLRSGIEQMPEAQLHDAIESRLLARALPGARLTKMTIRNQGDLDKPLVLAMQIEVPEMARRRGKDLVLVPPFPIRVSQLATLPRRQTPLLIGEPTYAQIHLALTLPKGAKVSAPASAVEVKDADRTVRVRDRQEGGAFLLDRLVDIPTGRVQPEAYPALQTFARSADEATLREIVITMP